jgi:hypothetical protein
MSFVRFLTTALGRNTRVSFVNFIAIFGLPNCLHAEEISTGKYFCFVSHLAGIQIKDDGQIVSGNFKPMVEKFFIDIHLAMHPSELCPSPGDGSLNDWFLCRAKFEIQIDSGRRLRGDRASSFLGPDSIGDQFVLYENGTFDQHETFMSSGGYFVSDGKCTRL